MSRVLKKDELDVKRNQFGLRFVKGGSPEGCIELYTEDDENWFLVTTFNHFWIEDLMKILNVAQRTFDRQREPSGRTLKLKEPNSQ